MPASSFLTDVYCLGVKDAFFTVLDEETYEGKLKHGIVAPYADGTYTNVHPSCLKKLILGAVRYADELGFPPHKDYKRTVALLDGIRPNRLSGAFRVRPRGQAVLYSGTQRIIVAGQTHR